MSICFFGKFSVMIDDDDENDDDNGDEKVDDNDGSGHLLELYSTLFHVVRTGKSVSKCPGESVVEIENLRTNSVDIFSLSLFAPQSGAQ